MIPTSDLIRLADEHRRDLERRAAAHRLARTVRQPLRHVAAGRLDGAAAAGRRRRSPAPVDPSQCAGCCAA